MAQIDLPLVQHLIQTQFPEWGNLPIFPVARGGWDNRTFRLGEKMLIRLPSQEKYVPQVEKEQTWLPRFAPHLPVPIPSPLALGQPDENYPWVWSIYGWIEGETAADKQMTTLTNFAEDLAEFLLSFQRIETTGGPPPGDHNFQRGGNLSFYDNEVRQAMSILGARLDKKISKIWDRAIGTQWKFSPVWVHGDISPGNLLVANNRLKAVIDFGGIGIGDPACDLAIGWSFFSKESRVLFYEKLSIDSETWERGRAWALWKALGVVSGLVKTNSIETERAFYTLSEVVSDEI